MYLAIETSGPVAFVAVGDHKKIFEVSRPNDGSVESRGSESLHLMAREVLQQANSTWHEIEALVVGGGPGSFTGLRIGFGFAQGVASALRVPCRQVASFEAWIKEFEGQGSAIAAIADAQRGEYFCQIFSSQGKILGEVAIIPGVDLISHARSLVGDNLRWIGFCDASQFGISATAPVKVGASLVSKAIDMPKDSYSALKIAELSPNYIRAVSARTLADRGKKIIT